MSAPAVREFVPWYPGERYGRRAVPLDCIAVTGSPVFFLGGGFVPRPPFFGRKKYNNGKQHALEGVEVMPLNKLTSVFLNN